MNRCLAALVALVAGAQFLTPALAAADPAGDPGDADQDFPPLVWGEHSGRIEWVDGAFAGASADAFAGHCVGSGCGPLSQLTSAVSTQGMLLPGGIRGGCAYASVLTAVNHPMPATAAPIAATCLILANMNTPKTW
jgi:hypothetical protein